MEGKHELEICGARIRIEDGRAEVMEPPKVEHCPMRSRVYGVQQESEASVLDTLRMNVEEWGMFTSARRLRTDERTVSFGASEIISDALRDGLLDAAVTVCEGAGTFVCGDPQVLEAVGAHMTGILSTSPIPAIQDGLRAAGCSLISDEAVIDQVAGLELAAELGHKRVALTLMGKEAMSAQALAARAEALGTECALFAVHTTEVCGFTAEMLIHFCDVVYLCASARLWEKAGVKAKVQMGAGIPVLGMTRRGKELILNRAMSVDDPLLLLKSGLPRSGLGERPRPLFSPDCASDHLSPQR